MDDSSHQPIDLHETKKAKAENRPKSRKQFKDGLSAQSNLQPKTHRPKGWKLDGQRSPKPNKQSTRLSNNDNNANNAPLLDTLSLHRGDKRKQHGSDISPTPAASTQSQRQKLYPGRAYVTPENWRDPIRSMYRPSNKESLPTHTRGVSKPSDPRPLSSSSFRQDASVSLPRVPSVGKVSSVQPERPSGSSQEPRKEPSTLGHQRLQPLESSMPHQLNHPEPPVKDPGKDPDMKQPSPEPSPEPSPQQYSMVRQLDTQVIPISQVHTELESICGVVNALEQRCRQILQVQQKAYRDHQNGNAPKPDDHFTTVLTLHRNLIHEEYDLFRASQYASTHPHATPDLQNFAKKIELPARLWKHGIHNLLELFRSRLPASKEYMNAYIILGYQMFTLLLETVTDFEEQWLECLGDISRYRMAIETSSAHERDLWLNLADSWYLKASVRKPELGRLLHHRAILARGKGSMPMLNFYARSLSTIEQFEIARDSLNITAFAPNLQANLDLGGGSAGHRTPTVVQSKGPRSTAKTSQIGQSFIDVFVRLHAVNFSNADIGKYNDALTVWVDSACQSLITTVGSKEYGSIGETTALVNIAAMLDWGERDSDLRAVFCGSTTNLSALEALKAAEACTRRHFRIWYLLTHTLALHLDVLGDESVLSHLHVVMVFLWQLSSLQYGSFYVDSSIPWHKVAVHLNSVQRRLQISTKRVARSKFVHHDAGQEPRMVVPEDHSLRGMVWCRDYLPESHFEEVDKGDSEGEGVGAVRASDAVTRAERCLWLGHRLVKRAKALDAESKKGPAGRRWLGYRRQEGFGVIVVGRSDSGVATACTAGEDVMDEDEDGDEDDVEKSGDEDEDMEISGGEDDGHRVEKDGGDETSAEDIEHERWFENSREDSYLPGGDDESGGENGSTSNGDGDGDGDVIMQ